MEAGVIAAPKIWNSLSLQLSELVPVLTPSVVTLRTTIYCQQAFQTTQLHSTQRASTDAGVNTSMSASI